MKPTTVHIRKTRHKDQPWTVTIQPPGKAEAYTIKQRYARPFTAKRGALRHLDARTRLGNTLEQVQSPSCVWWFTPRGSHIQFK